MDGENCCSLSEFILLGINNDPRIKVTFITFLVVYLIILVANLGMIILTKMDSQLHMSMYFFLGHLSFSDLCYSTEIGPKMLIDLLAKNKSIPFYGCALHSLIFCTFADSECLPLAVMACDRYKAISSPLLYAVSMSSGVCSLLMVEIYMISIVDALINTILIFHVCFCESNEINHFFYDGPPLSLSCADTQVNALVIFTILGFTELSTLSGLSVSYCYIILAVVKIHSAERRFKAFSTCTSHLSDVAIFQGTLLFMYFRPS
ncbi:hypothetical protein G4228_001760 [Cervus hanglu yarkandensis]|nr:hypothetical protein G4228_001760 [Cervus hanglu yarkandensis]